MAFKKIYIPTDAIQKREDFDVWYEDGDLFCHVKSKDWSSEKSKIELLGRTGGEVARIKPDYKALTYDIRVDKYTYTLHTYTIFKHYFFEGMLWQMHGSVSNGHANFENENTKKKDMLVTTAKHFHEGQDCYEVKVKDLSKLRPAAAAVIGMMVKEDFKGLSEGEPDENAKWTKKLKRYFWEEGIPYEAILADPNATK